MDLEAIACGNDGQSQQRRLKPLFSRQISKVFDLLTLPLHPTQTRIIIKKYYH